ncbi:MAG: low molecular weight protein-tyrosine-phosphatase [Planctomycetota bacterium]
MTNRILFVCMGNICRSPAGEGVMQHLVDQRQLDVHVDSAGTHGYHVGEPADSRMRKAARRRGYELTSRARKVERDDLIAGAFDVVLAADRANLSILHQLAPSTTDHIRLFSDFLDGDWPDEVPDPYYGGDDGFETVLDMLESGCPEVLSRLGLS